MTLLRPRQPRDAALADHLARVRAHVFAGQTLPGTRCPLGGCGEASAPRWPEGDLRRGAPVFDGLCVRHREVALAEVLRRDATVAEALAAARRAGPLAPHELPPPLPQAVLAARVVAAKMRAAAPARLAAKRATKPVEKPRRYGVRRCSGCGQRGHNARTCRAKGRR